MRALLVAVALALAAGPAFAQAPDLAQTERRANSLIVELQRQNRVANTTLAEYFANWQEALFQLGQARVEIAELKKPAETEEGE